MTNTQTPEQETDEEPMCSNPNIGNKKLSAYIAGTLSNEENKTFEDHLPVCPACQEELDYVQWVIRQTQTHNTEIAAEFFFRTYRDMPLPVVSVFDRNTLDLTAEYTGKPLRERLAASSASTGTIAFPFTVKYADGQVIGEFRKRVGQLFFHLKQSSIDGGTFGIRLVYTSPASPANTQTFDIKEGEDIRLGPFHEFVPSNTIQGMLEAIKHFQCFLRREQEFS